MANGGLRLMRLAAIAGAFTLWLAAPAEAESITTTISGKANIFSAGRTYTVTSGDGQGGVLPSEIALTSADMAGVDRSITFPEITGQTSWRNNEAFGSAEGETGVLTVQGLDRISGITSPRGLLGVFLDDQLPSEFSDHPESLVFGSESGAISTDFTSLSPELGQLFYIGDGKNSAGDSQSFNAPEAATKLYLGFADSGPNGGPGLYDDNQGELTVSAQSEFVPVPEPATFAIWGLALAACVSIRARKKR